MVSNFSSPWRHTTLMTVCVILLAASTSWAESLPVFDAHIHYSKPAWERFPPKAVLEIMRQAGIERAIVSSSPDDGTIKLYEAAPTRIVPFLRPYREGVDPSNWHQDKDLIPYLSSRLKRGIYQGIGEFHVFDPEVVHLPGFKQMMSLATEKGLYLYVHSGAEAVRKMLALDPRAKVFWAHAGMSEPPEVVGAMLSQYPTLITETSFRASDIQSGGTINPQWRALLIQHKDRIMVGTDTYITSRLGDCGELIGEHRRWLAQLPPEVAAAISYRNAARLFGSGGLKALQ